MKKHEATFSKKFINLLILQQERLSQKKRPVPGSNGFKSVGEILGSDKYIQHTKRRFYGGNK